MAEGHDNDSQGEHGKPVVSYRTMNIVVSLMLMIVATIVMVASYRLGAGWAKDVGPDSGYFPFYVSLIMFVTHRELIMVLQVLIPMTIFVVLAVYIGIYISMALFIGFFMLWHGRYSIYKTLPVMLLVPIVIFIVFEIWFLVPLPKGPFEAWLGY